MTVWLRKWIEVAERVRRTCQNADTFDQLIKQQRERLDMLERIEMEERARNERLAFGFPEIPDEGTATGELPPWPRNSRKRARTTEEAAMDRRLQKEREAADLDAFLPCYERATGIKLTVEEEAENPDFVTTTPDGSKIGIELTAVRQGPADSFYRPILTGNSEWDPVDAVDQMFFLITQKSSKVPQYRTESNILVLENVESDFDLMCNIAQDIPLEDFSSSGFSEIWLADYSGIRKGEHQEIQLFGLYPQHVRKVTRRSDRDMKKYR